MTQAKLYYVDGSPFARLCRALILDWNLPVLTETVPYPLPDSFFINNPLGQVPVLETVGETIFPTLQIVEQLYAMTEYSDIPRFDPLEDRQILTVILAMGDALLSANIQDWAGLTPSGINHLGYDPAVRNRQRAQSVLDWLEARADQWLCRDEVSVADYALAAILLWSESRKPIEWKNRKKLFRIVSEISMGDDFASTAPKPFKLIPKP